jgi:hypothetical protein
LGTPSREDVFEMNPDYDESESNSFPLIMASPWTAVFPHQYEEELNVQSFLFLFFLLLFLLLLLLLLIPCLDFLCVN